MNSFSIVFISALIFSQTLGYYVVSVTFVLTSKCSACECVWINFWNNFLATKSKRNRTTIMWMWRRLTSLYRFRPKRWWYKIQIWFRCRSTSRRNIQTSTVRKFIILMIFFFYFWSEINEIFSFSGNHMITMYRQPVIVNQILQNIDLIIHLKCQQNRKQ